MITFSYLLLAAACLGLCFWLWPRKATLHAPAQGALKAVWVALVLVVITALLLGLAGIGLQADALQHAQRMIGLAAQHMSLPLLGLACLYLGRGLRWKPVIWSQIILGLLAFYQLAQYLEWQSAYQWLVNLIGALCLVLTALLYLRRDRRISLYCLVAVVALLIPAALGNTLPLATLLSAGQQASWLLPGFVAAGLAVGLLAEQAHNRDSYSQQDGPGSEPGS